MDHGSPVYPSAPQTFAYNAAKTYQRKHKGQQCWAA